MNSNSKNSQESILEGIKIYVANSLIDLIRVRKFRFDVFVNENGVKRTAEYGANELASSTYILAVNKNHETVGLIAFEKHANFVRSKRMAVKPEYRKSGLSEMLNQKLIDVCRLDGYDKIYGLCEEALIPYWQKHGFKPIKNAEPMIIDKMTLIPICMELEPYEDHIKITDPAKRILAQEGSEEIKDNRLGVKDIDQEYAIYLSKLHGRKI